MATHTTKTNEVNANGSASATSSSPRPDSINEALRILDEALGGAGANLKDLVTNDFKNLKSALSDNGSRISENFRGMSGETFDRVSEIASMGMERGRRIYSEVDVQMRSNPWPILGGVAVGTFALGFLMGRGSSSSLEHQR